MRLNFIIPAFLLLLYAVVDPSGAQAQVEGSYVEFSGQLGMSQHDDHYGMESRRLYEFRVGYGAGPQWGVEAAFAYENSYSSETLTGSRDWLRYGIDGMLSLRPLEVVNPYLISGLGMRLFKMDGMNHWSPLLTTGAGLRISLGGATSIRTEGRLYFSEYNSWLVSDLVFSAGVAYAFGGVSDRDADGVPDARDRCPRTPGGAEVDPNGCPWDDDLDGVPRGLDKCPDTPLNTRVDEDGCATANWR